MQLLLHCLNGHHDHPSHPAYGSCHWRAADNKKGRYAESADKMQPYFRFRLNRALPQGRFRDSAAPCRTVRQWDEEQCRTFAETVHRLRLTCSPQEVAGRLGVSRHFLYQHFGWAMDKVAYVERVYGAPLGEVVARRRQEGATMAALAREWGLAVTTLYNALKGSAAKGSRLQAPAAARWHRPASPAAPLSSSPG